MTGEGHGRCRCGCQLLRCISFLFFFFFGDLISRDQSSIAEVTDDLRFLKAKGVLWAKICWVMAPPDGAASYGHSDNKWSTPVADFRFLDDALSLFRIYRTRELQPFIRRALFDLEGEMDDDENAETFREWGEFIERLSDSNTASLKKIVNIQSQIRFPTR